MGIGEIAGVVFKLYPRRTFVGLSVYRPGVSLPRDLFHLRARVGEGLRRETLIQSGEPGQIFIGYLVGAIVMILGGVIQATMGVEAAQRDLEDIAPPLSARGEEQPEAGEEADPNTLGRGEGRGTEHADGRFTRPAGADEQQARTTGGDR